MIHFIIFLVFRVWRSDSVVFACRGVHQILRIFALLLEDVIGVVEYILLSLRVHVIEKCFKAVDLVVWGSLMLQFSICT
jgi:hypothetical protein